jgi:hypothetical protein
VVAGHTTVRAAVSWKFAKTPYPDPSYGRNCGKMA